MKVSIIGSGDAGKELAASATAAGHDVRHSARSHKDAVKGSDLVVLAVPPDQVDEVLDSLSNDLDGKVIINVTDRVDPAKPAHVQFRAPRPIT
jgi:predicted dinucleotide-binding enzyme